MTTKWLLCNCCESWQPVRQNEAIIDLDGCRWQACEFCGGDDGPTIILVDGQAYNTDELNEVEQEEIKVYEQRTNDK
jgi:hypothetical protein